MQKLFFPLSQVLSASYLVTLIHGNQWRIQGGRRRSPPPYGARFFHFDIQIFRNVAASGVGAPPLRGRRPPMGNPGSATGNDAILKFYFPFL